MEWPLPVRHCSDCAACAVRSGSFAAGLDAVGLQLLDRSRISHRYQRGQTLFYEGNASNALFCVGSAGVRLVKSGARGKRHVLAVAGPGDLLGLEAVVTGQPYGHGAEVFVEGIVCQLQSTEVYRLTESDPCFQRAALQFLADALHQSQGECVQLAGGDVRERTAYVILTLCRRFGERIGDQVHLDLSLTRGELAEMIGVAEETAIRHLSQLRRRGILSLRGRSIVIKNPDRLARLARASSR